MKIILLATWPNGQTQHIYSTTSRLIAKSQFNAKLNRHIIEVAGPDAKFIAECVWSARAITPAVPIVVDENYDIIPLGSEFGPNLVPLENVANKPNEKATIPPVEKIQQDLPEPREMLVLPEQSATQESQAVAEGDGDLTINDDADAEADMPLEEVICKRVSEYGKLRVVTLAANLGVTTEEIKSAVKASGLLKITGTKNNTIVSIK
jgi:hypothetical protein